jgi:uncharacterized protein
MPQSSESSPRSPQSAESQPEYTLEERTALLQLAHDAILATLENRELFPFEPTPHLCEHRGAFTTVYANQNLRGCVGYPTAVMPLYRTVVETARGAAFDDPRFVPITFDEAQDLRLSISVLSPMRAIAADDIVVGRHGLLISRGSHRGLLLPQVPTEQGWDRVAFLEHSCRKAGLPPDAWKKGATLEAFTAEVFADPDCAERPSDSK